MNRRRDVDRTSLRRADVPALPATLPRRPRLDGAAWAALAVWVLATLTAGTAVGLAFAPDAWLSTLARPTWNPPSWLFAPIST